MRNHQVIALEKAGKTVAENEFTALYKLLQRPDMFNGFRKTYVPLDDEGQQLSPEGLLVQAKVDDVLKGIQLAQAPFWDLVATKDATNQYARADIVIDGRVLASDVSVSFLLWLEKKLVDVRTVLKHVPELPSETTWKWDANTELHFADPVTTLRQVKVTKQVVTVQATDKFPAQTHPETSEAIQGTWTNERMSGAVTPQRKRQLLAQVDKLIGAVKVAREEANSIDATPLKIGDTLLGYIFGA